MARNIKCPRCKRDIRCRCAHSVQSDKDYPEIKWDVYTFEINCSYCGLQERKSKQSTNREESCLLCSARLRAA